MKQQISIQHILNQKELISEYNIYEQFANPNRTGGTKHILFIKGKKYDLKWNETNRYYLIIGETGAECYILFKDGNKFDGIILQWDKSYNDYAHINCIKGGDEIIFPFRILY